MPCRHLFISGRVQGVWFRESMRQEALANGVTGWVRNLPDGMVEAVVCGSEAGLKTILDWARRGPTLAKVEAVEVQALDEQQFTGFEKRA